MPMSLVLRTLPDKSRHHHNHTSSLSNSHRRSKPMIFLLLFVSVASISLLIPLAFAQHHQPPIQDRRRSNGRYTALIVGVSIGVILLLFLASVLYAKFVSHRREASRGRAERGRADEELTITPLAVPLPLVVAPPPYENPPSFEDSTKRTQTESAASSQPRDEPGERNEVVG